MAAERAIEKLIREIDDLRKEFAWIGEMLVDRAREQSDEVAARVRRSARETWTEAKSAAAGVTDRIEDRPLLATGIAFGAGMVIGLLFAVRRR